MALLRSSPNEIPIGRATVRLMEAMRVMRRAENCTTKDGFKGAKTGEAVGYGWYENWHSGFHTGDAHLIHG